MAPYAEPYEDAKCSLDPPPELGCVSVRDYRFTVLPSPAPPRSSASGDLIGTATTLDCAGDEPTTTGSATSTSAPSTPGPSGHHPSAYRASKTRHAPFQVERTRCKSCGAIIRRDMESIHGHIDSCPSEYCAMAPWDGLRVITWNIERGYRLAKVVEALKEERADVIMLQEVDVGCERSFMNDVGAEIASALGMQIVFASEKTVPRPAQQDHRRPSSEDNVSGNTGSTTTQQPSTVGASEGVDQDGHCPSHAQPRQVLAAVHAGADPADSEQATSPTSGRLSSTGMHEMEAEDGRASQGPEW